MEDEKIQHWGSFFESPAEADYRTAMGDSSVTEHFRFFVGIDPGLSGAIAVLAVAPNGAKFWHALKMPTTEKKSKTKKLKSGIKTTRSSDPKGILDFISTLPKEQTFVVLEKLTSSPKTKTGESDFGRGGIAQFKLGRNVGELKTALIAFDIQHEEVVAQKWQKPYKDKDGLIYEDRKKILKEAAQSLLPNRKITLWNCDAFLLADYASAVLTQKTS